DINVELKAINQTLRVNAKIQVSDLFFTIGETGSYGSNYSINIGEFGNNGYGGQGYYKNHYREIHITKAYNYHPTMELYIFGFDSKEDAIDSIDKINFTYQSAYGGNTKYDMKCMFYNEIAIKGDGKSQQFPSNKWGVMIVDFGGTEVGYSQCLGVYKKHNGIYTFKTTYKGKTYTSILHLKLSE
ncbi:hypothetical protein L8W55_07890, partial [Campylobacter sp. FU_520]|uniref:hypothetical protein n=1 Tax=Campylobacter sp. FU_520 TaxID=2911611 RepID=UPI0021E63DF6